jgi:hypothetical protein
VDYGLQIITVAGGFRRVNDTIRIVKDGHTQGYMQVSMTPKNMKMQVMIISIKHIIMQKKLVIILFIFLKQMIYRQCLLTCYVSRVFLI